MAVYDGDVGLDEFAKHPNAKLLWQTAQARVTWAGDIAVWSSHDGEDTLFNQFAQQARATCTPVAPKSDEGGQARAACGAGSSADSSAGILACGSDGHPCPAIPSPGTAAIPGGEVVSGLQSSKFKVQGSTVSPSVSSSTRPSSPWNLYFRVTLTDAIELGLLDVISRTRDTSFNPEQFVADCSARSGSEEIFQQSYMCNPMGAAAASIVEWSAIERCRFDYEIERVHLEADHVRQQFGEFNSYRPETRRLKIEQFLTDKFPQLFKARGKHRLGFDVAASGQGDLAAFYIDELKGSDLWLRALLTVRTED